LNFEESTVEDVMEQLKRLNVVELAITGSNGGVSAMNCQSARCGCFWPGSAGSIVPSARCAVRDDGSPGWDIEI
jgi:hypothetical protein